MPARVVRSLATGLAIVLGGSLLIAAFFAYFVHSVAPETNIVYDGLGRELVEASWLVQFLFDTDALWAGWKWFIADAIIFFGGFGIIMVLIRLSDKD